MMSSTSALLRLAVQRLMSCFIAILMVCFLHYDLSRFLLGHYTRALRDGVDYLITGTKRFITNAPRAGAFTLMARTGGEGAAGISAFVVPANLPGISLGLADKKMGQRGTMTCDIYLDNVRVPADHIIGEQPGQ